MANHIDAPEYDRGCNGNKDFKADNKLKKAGYYDYYSRRDYNKDEEKECVVGVL